MRKAFTMVELIFIIVVVGILAAVALPRLAAVRYDAKAASIKSTIATAMNSVPAYYQGQKNISFLNAMSLDESVWNFTDSGCTATYTDGSGSIVMALYQDASTTPTNGCDTDAVTTDNNLSLQIVYNATADSNVINIIVNGFGSVDTRISINSKNVK